MNLNFIFYTFRIIFHLNFTQPIVAGGVRRVKSASSGRHQQRHTRRNFNDQLFNFGFVSGAAIYENISADDTPAAQALKPPLKSPINPS